MTDLTKIREALEGATEGPWYVEVDEGDVEVVVCGRQIHIYAYDFSDEGDCPRVAANARLIALAPDMARLCIEQAAEIERLRVVLDDSDADALVAVAYEAAALKCHQRADEIFTACLPCSAYNELCLMDVEIRALTPNDARAALDRMLAEAVEKERGRLLDEIADKWSEAMYGATENGVAWLNENASRNLAKQYPSIVEFNEWLNAIREGDPR